jgi:hypothetical protein
MGSVAVGQLWRWEARRGRWRGDDGGGGGGHLGGPWPDPAWAKALVWSP